MDILGFSLVMDVLVSILLVATVFYAVRLNKHFVLLKKQRDELAAQLTMFAESTRRAEQVVAMVKAATAENATIIERQIRRAEAARTDLDRSLTGVGAVPSDRRATLAQVMSADENSGGGRVGGARMAGVRRDADDAMSSLSPNAAADASSGPGAIGRPARAREASDADGRPSLRAVVGDASSPSANDSDADPRARLRMARMQKLRNESMEGGAAAASVEASSAGAAGVAGEPASSPTRSRSELLKALQGMR